MSEINDAAMIINTTFKTTGDVISIPVKVAEGAAELLQKVLLLLDAARRHHPEKGETMMDEFYKKYGMNFTTFTIPNDSKEEIYSELTKAGVEFTYYSSQDEKDETTILVPLQQNRTASEALERAKLSFLERSAAQHAAEELSVSDVKKMQEQYAADKGLNFPLGGVNEKLQELAIINEYQALAASPDHRLITFKKEAVIEEKENSVILSVPDGTIEIDKKGMIGGQHGSYYGFLDARTTYWLHRTDGTKKMLVVPDMMKNYFADAATMEENSRREYFAMLQGAMEELNHSEEAITVEHDAAQDHGVKDDVITVKENRLFFSKKGITTDNKSIVSKLDEDTYEIHIPKYHVNHDTGKREKTANHGLAFEIPKESCTEDEHTIYWEFDPEAEYELYDEDGYVAARMTGEELYRNNFNAVTHQETRLKQDPATKTEKEVKVVEAKPSTPERKKSETKLKQQMQQTQGKREKQEPSKTKKQSR